MTPIITNDLHIIFEKLDRNGDGRVSLNELCNLFDQIGISIHIDELKPLFDGNTSLDLIDFICFYDSSIVNNDVVKLSAENENEDSSIIDYNADEEKEVVEAFRVFDLNGDGNITAEELEKVLTRLGMWNKDCGSDCKSMIKAYDSNLDGVLDFEEFKNMLMLTISSS